MLFTSLLMACLSLSNSQNLTELKLGYVAQIFDAVTRLERRFNETNIQISNELQERDTLCAAKLDEMNVRISNELQERDTLCAAKLDDLQDQMSAMKEEQQIQKELLDKVSTLQELLLADECEMDTHSCSANAVCVDVVAGYQCSCLTGYYGDGFTCEDIDECRTGVHSCPSEAECINNQGAYTCACPIGFAFNGSSCEAFPCLSPSVYIADLGCITPVMEAMTWEAAKTNCRERNSGRLLQEITSRDQIDQLKEHFEDFFYPHPSPWVGVYQLKWVESGNPIPDSSPLWYRSEPDKGSDEKCGYIYLAGSDPGLFDDSCSYIGYSLCQK